MFGVGTLGKRGTLLLCLCKKKYSVSPEAIDSNRQVLFHIKIIHKSNNFIDIVLLIYYIDFSTTIEMGRKGEERGSKNSYGNMK